MLLDNFLKKNLPFNLDLLPSDSYVVGGTVRDILLNRINDNLDLDFVLPNSAIKTAKTIANLFNAGFVVLDSERSIARVVFPNITVDFAQQEGNSIDIDLLRRDYTINAIAYHCEKREIIDPLNGEKDLKKRIIKMICRDNLKDDPLRLFRGYRQACQLNFTIESDTRKTIKELIPFLTKVANERVNSELNYLLNNENGSYWIKEAFNDGLLSFYWHNTDEKKINYLPKIDIYRQWLNKNFISLNINNYTSAKLACLTSDNSDIAEKELINLKYSRQEIKAVVTILKYKYLLLEKNLINDLSAQYFFFLSVGKIFPNVAVFALAQGISPDLIILLMKRYLDKDDLIAHPQPLLSGNEIMESLKIPPSPLIKQLLTNVQIAHIEGKINNKNEALQWIINHRL